MLDRPPARYSFYTTPLLYVESVVSDASATALWTSSELANPHDILVVPGSKDLIWCNHDGNTIERLFWSNQTVGFMRKNAV